MIPMLQKELDSFKDGVWNCHRICTQKDTLLPDGVPNHMYAFPAEYGLEESGISFNALFCFFLHCILRVLTTVVDPTLNFRGGGGVQRS